MTAPLYRSTRTADRKFKIQRCGHTFNAANCPICPYCKRDARRKPKDHKP